MLIHNQNANPAIFMCLSWTSAIQKKMEWNPIDGLYNTVK